MPTSRRLRVFLCHATEDKPTVRVLYKRLKSDGYDTWFDEKNIVPGQDWKLEITKGLRSADVIIICLSSISVRKEGYIQVEIKEALENAKKKPEGAIYIIPVKLDDCKAPTSLEDKQWVNFFDGDGYNKLKRGLSYCKKVTNEKEETVNAGRISQKTKDSLFLKAIDFSIFSGWAKEIPNGIVEGFTDPEPPVIFFGSGFGKEAIPPLKTGEELAKELRGKLGLNDDGNGNNLFELLNYLQNKQEGSKRNVAEWLKKNLDYGSSKPGGAYRLILQLPCKIFLTTNYDSLIINASHQIGYKLLVVDNASAFLPVYNDAKSRPNTGLLGRLHGSFEFQENIVSSADDLIIKTQHWQELIKEIFQTRQVIFIGFDIRNFIGENLFSQYFTKLHNSDRPHVLVGPTKSEHVRLFWYQYNIKYVPLKAYQFLIAIHEQLGNLEKNEQIAISAVATCLEKNLL